MCITGRNIRKTRIFLLLQLHGVDKIGKQGIRMGGFVIGKDRTELIAADPVAVTGSAEDRLDTLACSCKCEIAKCMSVGVIDQLEIVDVEIEDQSGLMDPGDMALVALAVQKAGQRIGILCQLDIQHIHEQDIDGGTQPDDSGTA